MFKALIVKLFLSKEVAALKERLAEASAALQKIETKIVAIPKEAAPEVHKLAGEVLQEVLNAADQVRTKESGFVHGWEAEAYKLYIAGKAQVASVYSHALALIEKTKVFFK